MMIRFLPLVLVLSACAGPKITDKLSADGPPLDLRVEYTDAAAATALFGKRATFEVLLDGMKWAEGPVVLPDGTVLVSDIPNNRILGWRNGKAYTAMSRSGGVDKDYSYEPGSNGLALDLYRNNVLMCRHGSRDVVSRNLRVFADDSIGQSMVQMTDTPLQTTVADNYQGMRFNSPNDLVVSVLDGSVWFTDPPYGLPGQEKSDLKELDYCGVYRAIDGVVQLLTDEYSRPNGIGFSPDYRTLYIANSDPERAIITATEIIGPQIPAEPLQLGSSRILFDGTNLVSSEPGLPDGLCVARNGRIFATGPGGVWVLEPDGHVVARVRTGQLVANVTLDPKEEWLYLASHYYLIRIKISSENAPTERPGN